MFSSKHVPVNLRSTFMQDTHAGLFLPVAFRGTLIRMFNACLARFEPSEHEHMGCSKSRLHAGLVPTLSGS
eukprot:628487-Amphidinium_carterae.3